MHALYLRPDVGGWTAGFKFAVGAPWTNVCWGSHAGPPRAQELSLFGDGHAAAPGGPPVPITSWQAILLAAVGLVLATVLVRVIRRDRVTRRRFSRADEVNAAD